jgi:hypothetical protein
MNSRPLYETAAHRAAELVVKQRLEQAWKGFSLVKIPRRYVLDYAIIRGLPTDPRARVVGFCEIKCRTHLPDTYQTLLVSAAKWLEADKWRRSAAVFSTVLVASFADGSLYRCRLDEIVDPVFVMGGRTDRNDPEDVEPVLAIPIKSMVAEVGDAQ